MMRSTESASSVFYHSQEEDPVRTSADGQGSYREAPPGPPYDSCQDSVTDGSPVTTERDSAGTSAQRLCAGCSAVRSQCVCSTSSKVCV